MRNTQFLKSLILLLACLSLTIPASAQTPSPTPAPLDKNFLISNIFDDLGSIALSPLAIKPNDLFYIIPIGAAIGYTISNEVSIYNSLHDPRNQTLDDTMPYVTDMGDGITELAACGLIYALGGKKEKQIADTAIEAMADMGVTVVVLKAAFGAPRPEKSTGNRQFFNYSLAKLDGSFPSGHTAAAFTFATVLGRAYHQEILAYTLASAVGYSRIYLSAHWPSDVLLGAAIGTWIGSYVYDKRMTQNDPGKLSLGGEINENGVPSLTLTMRW